MPASGRLCRVIVFIKIDPGLSLVWAMISAFFAVLIKPIRHRRTEAVHALHQFVRLHARNEIIRPSFEAGFLFMNDPIDIDTFSR
jgi:hypothetical protein